ncbi:MAG: hypothetical protein ASARMPRED_009302 [Alectoria sarmentosa]|nr:MAG: hypothetical protein ASARMPRED_009302 [Alectoria sarmentosa]
MASKKRKRSALSPHPNRGPPKQATAEETVQKSGRNICSLFFPVHSSLLAVQKATKQGLPDQHVRAKILLEELVKLGNHVEYLASEPGMTEDDRVSFWLFVSSYWPNLGTRAENLRSLYDRIKGQPKAETKKMLEKLNPEPFLETGLGGLAPEIREMIFINLLGIPPRYSGRDFRVEQAPVVGRPPTSLMVFVDLRTSCLAILQTCRQIYLEAFPIFYAGKSYFLANSQDLAIFVEFGGYLKIGPRLFRVDTITSLCLKDLVVNRPKWRPQQIDYLMSQIHTFNREELEAERTDELDSKLVLVDFGKMRSLRKICLCMRVGQEWQYLQFLFNIRGLRRGVIDFEDKFHWTLRSQNIVGDDWNLQYTAFPNMFFLRGKDFEHLDYHDVGIQADVLNIDSRVSDLVEGDERWVEVDIGSRNYEEGLPERQHARNVLPGHSSGNQQGVPSGEDVEPPMDDGSNRGPEYLQGQLDGEEHGIRIENELGQDSDDLQRRSRWEEDGPQGQPDAEGSDTQIHNQQDQDFEDIQGQPSRTSRGAISDNQPDQESDYPPNLAEDNDLNALTESNTNQEPETLQAPLNEDYAGASTEPVPKEESNDLQGPLNTEDRNASIATEHNQELEPSVESVGRRIAYVQEEVDLPQIPAIGSGGNEDDVEAQPGEEIRATNVLPSGLENENDRDVHTQTEPINSKNRNAETQPELGESVTHLQTETQITIGPIQRVAMPNQGAVFQSKVRNRQQVPTQSKLKPRKDVAVESLQKTRNSTGSQQSLEKPSTSSIPEKPKVPLATVDNKSTPKVEDQSLPTSLAKRCLRGSVRAAALILSLYLFYVAVYANLENTLGQLLALILSIPLFFLALSSESD